ncbi:MAG: carbonate dehydratase [Gammaproteobacteria bacterium]|jgi:carbonic anhydrase|nr:carbonate dehydratase [Gammaproteobacteria bacterium]
MSTRFESLLEGYREFHKKYVAADQSIMRQLAVKGQSPEVMVIACSDSRVDPALLLQCDPGDIFVVRNVANIVPPYEKDSHYHGTSAALEFAIQFLKIKDLILLGHSQCGGIEALLNPSNQQPTDFISNWVSIVKQARSQNHTVEDCVKEALHHSYRNCLTFPWIADKVSQGSLDIHRWFFEIRSGKLFSYSNRSDHYEPLV